MRAAAGNPIGSVDRARELDNGRIEVSGWAADPEAPGEREEVHIYVNGQGGSVQGTAGNFTGVLGTDVAAAYPWAGQYQGFSAVVPNVGSGDNQVCVYAINVSPPRTDPLLGRRTVTVHLQQPVGYIDAVTVDGDQATVTGWAFDPSRPRVSIPVHIWVFNNSRSGVQGLNTDIDRPDVDRVYSVAGRHGFSGTVGLMDGVNTVCAYGIGENGNNPLIGACHLVTVGSPASGIVVRSTDFSGLPLGPVRPADFINSLGDTNRNAAAYDDMTVVSDSRGGRAVRTTLRAGTIHNNPGSDNGDNLFISLPANYDRACMQYDVRFDPNFDWSLGGKLPGLSGVAPGVAPAAPTGGNSTTLGWSGRLMWLTPRSYGWAGPTNMAVSYLYHPGQAGPYGDNVQWGQAFDAGSWHTVTQCYEMNTVGRSDGTLVAWMDGQQVVNDPAYVYRTRSDVHINYIIFSVFRGGNTMDWAGTRDGYVDITNISITTG